MGCLFVFCEEDGAAAAGQFRSADASQMEPASAQDGAGAGSCIVWTAATTDGDGDEALGAAGVGARALCPFARNAFLARFSIASVHHPPPQ